MSDPANPDTETKTLQQLLIWSVKAFFQWFLGQQGNTVILIIILAGLGVAGHYSVTIAIPSHLKTIQEGYERIEASHREERTETRAMYDRWFAQEHPQQPPARTAIAKP